MKYSLTREPVVINFEDNIKGYAEYIILSGLEGNKKVFSCTLDFEKVVKIIKSKYKDNENKEGSYQKGLNNYSNIIYTKFMNLFFSYGDVKKEIEKLIKGGDPIKLV